MIGDVSKTEQDGMRALLQYDNEYKGKQLGYFQSPIIQNSAKYGDSHLWKSNGVMVPELQFLLSEFFQWGLPIPQLKGIGKFTASFTQKPGVV